MRRREPRASISLQADADQRHNPREAPRRRVSVVTFDGAAAFKASRAALGVPLAAGNLGFRNAIPALTKAGVQPAVDPDGVGCFVHERKDAGEALRNRT